MKLPYRPMRPPQALRKARLDNIAIIPASLLLAPHQAEYKAAANRLHAGDVLIVTPRQSRQRKIIASVTRYYEDHGHQVTTIPMELVINRQAAL